MLKRAREKDREGNQKNSTSSFANFFVCSSLLLSLVMRVRSKTLVNGIILYSETWRNNYSFPMPSNCRFGAFENKQIVSTTCHSVPQQSQLCGDLNVVQHARNFSLSSRSWLTISRENENNHNIKLFRCLTEKCYICWLTFDCECESIGKELAEGRHDDATQKRSQFSNFLIFSLALHNRSPSSSASASANNVSRWVLLGQLI